MGDERLVYRVKRWRAATFMAVAFATAGAGLMALALINPPERLEYRIVGYGVLLVVFAVGLIALDRRAPRLATATSGGLELRWARSARVLAWEQVLRARSVKELGFSGRDTYLELDDGDLVRLPEGMPNGTIDAWRTRLGAPAPRPRPGGPFRWRVPRAPAGSWQLTLGPLLVLQLSNLFINPAFDYPPFVVPVVLSGLLLLGVVGWLVIRRVGRIAVEATAEGITVPRSWGRRRYVPWSQVERLRGKLDRWDSQQVLELTDGTTVDLPRGMPAPLVEEWRAELALGDRPDAHQS